jgi:hypothetical protein
MLWRSAMRKRLVLVVTVLLLCCACASKNDPLVMVDMLPDDAPSTPRKSTLANMIFPPVCEELDMPGYPESLVDLDLPPVSVSATLTISKEGKAQDLVPTLLDETDYPDMYIDAVKAAVARWRCEPAGRPPRPRNNELEVQPVDYRAKVVFHFYSDSSQHGEAVKVEFQR